MSYFTNSLIYPKSFCRLFKKLNSRKHKCEMAPVTAASHSAANVIVTASKEKSQKVLMSRNFKKESTRLKTFVNWPVSFLNAKDLAKNGFYFTKIDDVVKCAFCKTQIGFWEEGDDPTKDHLKLSPRCPFLKNQPCGNIPLSEDREEDDDDDQDDEDDADDQGSQDVCGISSLEIRPFSEPERSHKSAFSIDSTNLWKDFEELGVTKTYDPVAPHYATYASRIKTYEKWKSHSIQKPEKLAEAGFYYIGHKDNVICFHCGGGLKDWEKDEDPWVEHARWFSKCQFVFLQKGKDFINEVVLRKKAYLTAETAREILNRSKKHGDSTSTSTSTSASSSTSASASASKQSSGVIQQSESKPNKVEENPLSRLNSKPSPNTTDLKEEKLPSAEGKELQMCIICYTRERGIVFLPCGHFVCCLQCTSALTKCAVCREPFKATVRAYFS